MRKRGVVLVLLAALVVGAVFAWNGVRKSLTPVEAAAGDSAGGADLDASGPEELAAVEEEAFVPSEEEVLAAREQALTGMTQEQAQRLAANVRIANGVLENQYLYNNIFGKLEDPDSLYWNYFDQTGEFQVGWAYSGELDMEEACERENLTEDEFYAKYGARVVTASDWDADAFAALMDELRETVQNEALRADLQYIIDETRLAKETHMMEHANNIYKTLHDLDYFLFRYGPTIDKGKDTWIQDKSTVSKYYGMLTVYS